MLRVAAVLALFKLILALDLYVGHDHSQHLLMDVDSRYSVRHNVSPGGSAPPAANSLTRVAGYRSSPRTEDDAHLFAPSHTRQLRHVDDLNFHAATQRPPLKRA